MLSLSHTIISLPFAEYLHSWFLIFVSAVLLHLLADTTLHWNIMPSQFKRFLYGLIFLDVAAGLILTWFLVGKDIFTPPYLAAIVGGNITDILHVIWNSAPKYHAKFPRAIRQFFSFHHQIQLETFNVPRGITLQLVALAIAVYLLLK